METQDVQYITIQELAKEFRTDASMLRRWAMKRGLTWSKVRSPEARGQLCLSLNQEDAEILRSLRKHEGYDYERPLDVAGVVDTGCFYIVQVIPDFWQARVKLGFSSALDSRLASYKTVSPTATLLKSYPCRAAWELAAMASITRVECKQIGQEVYDCDDLDKLVERAEQFFALMPHQEEFHA